MKCFSLSWNSVTMQYIFIVLSNIVWPRRHYVFNFKIKSYSKLIKSRVKRLPFWRKILFAFSSPEPLGLRPRDLKKRWTLGTKMPCLSLQAPRACALCKVITVTAMLLFLSNGNLLTSYTCVTKNELCGIKKTVPWKWRFLSNCACPKTGSECTVLTLEARGPQKMD